MLQVSFPPFNQTFIHMPPHRRIFLHLSWWWQQMMKKPHHGKFHHHSGAAFSSICCSFHGSCQLWYLPGGSSIAGLTPHPPKQASEPVASLAAATKHVVKRQRKRDKGYSNCFPYELHLPLSREVNGCCGWRHALPFLYLLSNASRRLEGSWWILCKCYCKKLRAGNNWF